MKEKKLLSKWSSFTYGLAVILLFCAVFAIILFLNFSACVSLVVAAVSLFLTSSILDWMGEVTCQQAMMIRIMQTIRDNQENAHYAAERTSAPANTPPTGSTKVDAFIKGTPQSAPGTFDAEQVADIYRRSQHSDK